MNNNISSWTVFFCFESLTTIYTTILTKRDDVDDEELEQLAADKIKSEMGIDVYTVKLLLGGNHSTDSGRWIIIEHNDVHATDQELEALTIND